MKRYLLVIALVCATASGAHGLEFSFDTGTQGWAAENAATGAPPLIAIDGRIRLDYSTATEVFDPRLIGPPVPLPARWARWLVIEVDLIAALGAGPQPFQLFFANEAGGFSEGRSRVFSVLPNAGPQRHVIDLSLIPPGKDPWEGMIERVRLDPGTSEADLLGYACEIDFIAFTLDTDRDGISDEEEYALYGNLVTVDGSAVPVGSAGILAALMGLAGIATLARRRMT
jgi:hypothetical protein